MSNIVLPCDDWFYIDVIEDNYTIMRMRSYLYQTLNRYHKEYRLLTNVVSEDAPKEELCRMWFRIVKKNRQLRIHRRVHLNRLRDYSLGSVATNIIPLCKSCNLSKGMKYPMDWLIWKYNFDVAEKTIARIKAYFDFVRERNNM